jgi:hypothetical protein
MAVRDRSGRRWEDPHTRSREHEVSGLGFNPNGGGFAWIVIDGTRYNPDWIAELVRAVAHPLHEMED